MDNPKYVVNDEIGLAPVLGYLIIEEDEYCIRSFCFSWANWLGKL